MEFRNLAIIAHVDHGKTTLVDCLLRQSGMFREGTLSQECILDSNPQERERGITIFAKNCAIRWRDYKINLIDTPGHADFGGEVQRVLRMADGCLLLVDASEGPMPQTRYVLRNAFEAHLRPIVVINKIDRPDARIAAVMDEVLDLFISLGAGDAALDFPVLYASGKHGFARRRLTDTNTDILPLFEEIVKSVPPPRGSVDNPLQLLVTTLDYTDYVGRIAVGRVFEGKVREGQKIVRIAREGTSHPATVEILYAYEGLTKGRVKEAVCGDIIAIAGIPGIGIGDTIADAAQPKALPTVPVDEPTLVMMFATNTGPFSGRTGKYLTSRHLRERLWKELESNVALRVETTDSPDTFRVSGRGILHLEVLIETMRREGYEMIVGKPNVIYRMVDGKECEPIEHLTIDVPGPYAGAVIELLGARRGQMLKMEAKGDRTHLDYTLPSRGFIGLRTRMMNATRGEAVLHHGFHGYEPTRGAIPRRSGGVMVTTETGRITGHALEGLADRGVFFVKPGDEVYAGQIVGERGEEDDIEVNACRKKKMTNIRTSTAENTVVLRPPRTMALDAMLEYVEEDEWVEVTPGECRLRKRELNESMRFKARSDARKVES